MYWTATTWLKSVRKQNSAGKPKTSTARLMSSPATSPGSAAKRSETGSCSAFWAAANREIAYARVSLNIVDVGTAQVVHSAQGAGEYSLASREIAGFGSTASYDATLNGKVLDLAIREAINKLVGDIDSGAWRPRRQ